MKKRKVNRDRGSMARRSGPYASQLEQNSGSGTGNVNELTIGKDGLEAPDNIIASESQARNFFETQQTDHDLRFGEYSKIQKQFYGHRPLNEKKLKEKGLDYKSNVNNGHARIHVNKYLSSEYNLLHGVASPVSVTIRAVETYTDLKMAKAIERAFKKVYADWVDYHVQLDAMRQDRCLFGLGVTLRTFDAKAEQASWKFKAISPDQFLFPLSTELTPNSLSKFCVKHTLPAQDLWNTYNKLGEDGDESWDKDALGFILWRASSNGKDDKTTQPESILEMQRAIRNYEKSVGSFYSDDIKLVSVYTKEWSGKWSHTIIHESYTTTKPLFFKDEQYEKATDFIQIWCFEPNQKTYSSVRGLGYRIYQPVEVQNRLDNTLIDQSQLASTIFIRTRAGRGRDAKGVKINLGAINDIGEAEFVEQMVAANLDASLKVNQYQGQILERNAQYEGMNIDEPDNKARTLGEVGMQATRDAVITKPQVSFFYRQMDLFIQNTFRLIWEIGDKDPMFEEFIEEVRFELRNDNIPEDVVATLFKMPTEKDKINRQGLPKWIQVKSARSTSSGSQVADILAANRMFQLAQFMGTDERYTFLQMATAAYSDHENVQLFFPDKNRPEVFTNPMQKAVMENAILTGLQKEIPVSQNDNHAQEAPVHIQGCQEIIQMWQQGGDVIQAYQQLKNLYPHFLGHFTMLSQNPLDKALFESLGPIRGAVENQFKMIEANANAAMAAQQKREEADRLAAAQEQLRLNPNSPDNLKILVDHELASREQDLQESRAMKSDNLQNIKAQVASNLDSVLKVQDFKLKQRRENIKLVSTLRKDQAEIDAKTNQPST